MAVFIFWCFWLEPISRSDSHFYRMLLAGFVILILFSSFYFRKKWSDFSCSWRVQKKSKHARVNKIYFLILTMSAIFGVFNYFQFSGQTFGGIDDYSDATYYYINSKYFDELGYYDLYPAILIADQENQNRLSRVRQYRDLRSYKIVSREIAITEISRIKVQFSEARWSEFQNDLNFIVSHNVSGGWNYFFIDHGYNPPPTWTLIGGTLSELTPVENLKLLTMVDFVLVAVAFIVIARSFGIEATLFALLFFVTTFSGRWPILGHSILRFDWLVTLISAVCALKSRKNFWAGGLLMYSSLMRIFPAIFFFPYFFKIIVDFWRTKKIAKQHKQFLAGALLVLFLLFGASLLRFDSSVFLQSKENLLLHNSPVSYSSHRVGLGDALFFRGETTRNEMNLNGGIEGKSEQIQAVLPWLYFCGFLSLLTIFIYIIRQNPPGYQIIALAAIPLFCVTNPQINYYNLRILLILWAMTNINTSIGRFSLVWLFLIEVAAQATKVMGFVRYTTTTITSIGLVIYFFALLGFLIYKSINQKQTSN